MSDVKFPKVIFEPDGTIKAMQYLDCCVSRLQQVSGYSIEELIDKFAEGYTLQRPLKVSMSMGELAKMASELPDNENRHFSNRRYSGVQYTKK